MRADKYIKLFAGHIVSESKLDKETKLDILEKVKNSNTYEVIGLLLDGEFPSVSEQSKPILFERFKKSDVPEKIKHYIKEQEENKKIDKDDVKQAAMKAAKKIHKKPDEKIIDDMVNNAIKKAKDTEDAIQIVINMLRS